MTQPIVNPSRQEFQGRSLAYIRTVLHQKQVAWSCWSMAEKFKDHLTQQPDIGMVCFFGTREPGDAGLLIDSGRLLMLDPQGRPLIVPIAQVRDTFIGAMYWPETRKRP